jgi:5-formyltetrahydrofolate cyclo-ligase
VNEQPTKSQLRQSLKASLNAMSDEQRAKAASMLTTRITTSDLIQHSIILAYASLPTELSLDPLINHSLATQKTVCIPAVDWDSKTMQPVQIESLDNNLQIGRYDLRSPRIDCKPIPDDQITLALIPGLGFDPAGNRLGRGAGFYDRWIEARRRRDVPITLVGVCFDEQIVERIPTDPHDQRMDMVITPTTTYTIR